MKKESLVDRDKKRLIKLVDKLVGVRMKSLCFIKKGINTLENDFILIDKF